MVMITHVFKVCDLIKKMKTNNWYWSVVPLETDHNIVHAGFFSFSCLLPIYPRHPGAEVCALSPQRFWSGALKRITSNATSFKHA